MPRTSTYALNNATLPYTLQLARMGAGGVDPLERRPAQRAANVLDGQLTYRAVSDAFDLPFVEPKEVVAQLA